MNTPTIPTLDPPGAGLPSIELWIARQIFRMKRWLGSRDAFTAQFIAERQAIDQIISNVNPSSRSQRVLIPRLRGLEDSSRFWSVWMTLEHLRITNSVFTAVIKGLSDGHRPKKQASTADVKPRDGVGSEVESAFQESCDQLLSTVATLRDLHSSVTYAHPWFGEMDAAAWHALAATHMGIHRSQIDAISSRLKAQV